MPRTKTYVSAVRACYIVFLAVVAGSLLTVMARSNLNVSRAPELVPTLLLGAIGVIAESNLGRFRGAVSISLTTIATTTALPLAGIYGALIIGICSTALLLTTDPLISRFFNSLNLALCILCSGFAYSLVGGLSPIPDVNGLQMLVRHLLLPIVIAVAVSFAVNIACLSVMIALAGGQSLGPIMSETAGASWSVYPGYAATSFIFVVLWAPAKLGALSIFPILVPLLLAQWSVSVRVRENESHLRSVETLVAAGQAGQSMLRGRSTWVDVVSAEIGLELRLSSDALQSLQFAALLHDIGLVAPAARSPGEFLNANELEWIRAHPQQGVLMLQGIDFLSDSVDAIGHHHERWDGRGYPSGLQGLQIPRLARLLAVSDTYCALIAAEADLLIGDLWPVATQALDVVQSLSGLQLDPKIVQALERAHPRVVEALSELIARDAPLAVKGVDPHLPWVSDLFADVS
ncbi:MAG: HD domain-containing phosphohydrolase [Allobranchiibius sp.]